MSYGVFTLTNVPVTIVLIADNNGKAILNEIGFINNNSTNPWLPESGSYTIRFLSPSTFSVFGFDATALTNANSGNCVVKSSCASNEFNCFQNNITRAISNCGRTHVKLSYNKQNVISINAEVTISGTKRSVTAKFYQLIWDHISNIGEDFAAITRPATIVITGRL